MWLVALVLLPTCFVSRVCYVCVYVCVCVCCMGVVLCICVWGAHGRGVCGVCVFVCVCVVCGWYMGVVLGICVCGAHGRGVCVCVCVCVFVRVRCGVSKPSGSGVRLFWVLGSRPARVCGPRQFASEAALPRVRRGGGGRSAACAAQRGKGPCELLAQHLGR